ncbi:hypothetical protein BGX21_005684 [Mortierella sp. AD011]|nr:hypothetical protein BGX21_005684 [Mortierella sp. AD011]
MTLRQRTEPQSHNSTTFLAKRAVLGCEGQQIYPLHYGIVIVNNIIIIESLKSRLKMTKLAFTNDPIPADAESNENETNQQEQCAAENTELDEFVQSFDDDDKFTDVDSRVWV